MAGVAGVRSDPRVLGQLGERHLGGVGQPVGDRDDGVEGLGVQRYVGQSRIVGGRRPAVLDRHGDVDLPVQQHRQTGVALGVLDPDTDTGCRRGEPGHGGRDDLGDAGGERGHRDRAGLPDP
ncbi:hypothetical protein SHKM778_38580 [Streptomyces sp. KM77-8]|uniref:Uncharacterized protein n=1 Tax=Streptomyces haneummycinicus TaxID=3074435 RepID=A0AAT9HJ71_9ACTN